MLVQHLVTAAHVPVIGSKDNDGVFPLAGFLQRAQKLAEMTGKKSKTAILRLLNDQSSKKTILKFHAPAAS